MSFCVKKRQQSLLPFIIPYCGENSSINHMVKCKGYIFYYYNAIFSLFTIIINYHYVHTYFNIAIKLQNKYNKYMRFACNDVQ